MVTASEAFPVDLTSAVWQLLEAVPDPEIPVVSIRELGILRDVRMHASGRIEVVITPTYSGCPAMGQIEDDVKAALRGSGTDVCVVTQLAPAWTTDWMTESCKTKLREYGIAPPQQFVGDAKNRAKPIHFTIKNRAAQAIYKSAPDHSYIESVPCPRCGSSNTTETSHFASTACKALYKCLACLEPFDYFKPY